MDWARLRNASISGVTSGFLGGILGLPHAAILYGEFRQRLLLKLPDGPCSGLEDGGEFFETGVIGGRRLKRVLTKDVPLARAEGAKLAVHLCRAGFSRVLDDEGVCKSDRIFDQAHYGRVEVAHSHGFERSARSGGRHPFLCRSFGRPPGRPPDLHSCLRPQYPAWNGGVGRALRCRRRSCPPPMCRCRAAPPRTRAGRIWRCQREYLGCPELPGEHLPSLWRRSQPS